MNLPMSWLNDYMDIDVTPKEYSDRLTMTGSKVEGWENMGESVQNVVAGKVLTCEPFYSALRSYMRIPTKFLLTQ